MKTILVRVQSSTSLRKRDGGSVCTSELNVNSAIASLKRIQRAAASLLALSACLLLAAPGALAEQPAAENLPVGQVSLVLGKARVIRAGAAVSVTKDMAITVSDRIETESNGHVHIRFVDDALVSVRPNSHLTIQRYDYDVSQPELSAVKFELQEGVTRAISGEAAKAARDRFRLNTPIAAIGVRGTDFVVSADAGTTRALVNEGTIVMAPFSEGCSSDALGPCVANALELSGDTLQLASVNGDEPLPQILPPQSIRSPNMMQEEVQLAVASQVKESNTANNPGAQVEVETPVVAAAPSVAQADAGSNEAVNNELLLEGAATPAVTDAEVAAVAAAEAALIPPDFTPSRALTVADLGYRQLVWGRYADNPDITDRIPLSLEEASEGRAVSVGNLDYGLFRADAADGSRRVNSELGIVGFQLNSAQAVYNSSTGVVAMAVNDGSLNIDFQENAFFTALTLNSELTGQVDFSANGRIVDGGFLRAIEATQRVAGAVSFDGTEAGYLFEQQLENGVVSGLTLWDSE